MRIGERAVANDLTPRTIRFCEQAGPLPAPPRTAGGYRDHPSRTGARPALIRDSRSAGLTLAEIRSILVPRDSGEAPCAYVTGLRRAVR
ncbi:MerR family DNA-binding transcriptional regulator [Streptomyces sp. NPDC058145]|uniref:MerR family DNA-binding transcriptional regulator n=1 Tax=Streptomyces sp. NPDC058145 TaxID=3346356 RepID=UPI0036E03CC2